MRQVTVVKLDAKLVEQYRKVARKMDWPMNHAIEQIMTVCLPHLEKFLKPSVAGIEIKS